MLAARIEIDRNSFVGQRHKVRQEAYLIAVARKDVVVELNRQYHLMPIVLAVSRTSGPLLLASGDRRLRRRRLASAVPGADRAATRMGLGFPELTDPEE